MALHTQLDNVCQELHELLVENNKLWGQNLEELEQLREEVTDLWQQLHEAQENEVGSNQHLQESHKKINELKQHVNESKNMLMDYSKCLTVLCQKTNSQLMNLNEVGPSTMKLCNSS